MSALSGLDTNTRGDGGFAPFRHVNHGGCALQPLGSYGIGVIYLLCYVGMDGMNIHNPWVPTFSTRSPSNPRLIKSRHFPEK